MVPPARAHTGHCAIGQRVAEQIDPRLPSGASNGCRLPAIYWTIGTDRQGDYKSQERESRAEKHKMTLPQHCGWLTMRRFPTPSCVWGRSPAVGPKTVPRTTVRPEAEKIDSGHEQTFPGVFNPEGRGGMRSQGVDRILVERRPSTVEVSIRGRNRKARENPKKLLGRTFPEIDGWSIDRNGDKVRLVLEGGPTLQLRASMKGQVLRFVALMDEMKKKDE